MSDDQKIERYILGKMDEHEEKEFEEYFLSDQESLGKLELAEELHAHFGKKTSNKTYQS